MTVPQLQLVLRRYGVAAEKTEADVKAQCITHMKYDQKKPERSVNSKDKHDDKRLRGITMRALLDCWDNNKRDFVFAPPDMQETVLSPKALEKQPAAAPEPASEQCFSASASNRAYERSQAKQQRNRLKEQDEQIENDRRKNLSGEERKQEDAQTMFESERLFDMQEAERKSKIPQFVSSSDAHFLVNANAHLDYDDPPSASASSGDRDKSLADTMRISPEIVEIFDSD